MLPEWGLEQCRGLRPVLTQFTEVLACRPPPPSRRIYDATWHGPNGRFAYLCHVIHLARCEYPMSEHRQWLGVTQMPNTRLEAAPKRPPLKRRLLLGMGAAHPRCACVCVGSLWVCVCV